MHFILGCFLPAVDDDEPDDHDNSHSYNADPEVVFVFIVIVIRYLCEADVDIEGIVAVGVHCCDDDGVVGDGHVLDFKGNVFEKGDLADVVAVHVCPQKFIGSEGMESVGGFIGV